MIVPDASAVSLLFTDQNTDHRVESAREALAADPAWIVPEHWHVEMFSVIRGLWLGGRLDDGQAQRATTALAQMTVGTTPTAPLLPRMWELRSSVSAYDAAYIAAAESHDLTLITADAKLVRSGAARCPITLIS